MFGTRMKLSIFSKYAALLAISLALTCTTSGCSVVQPDEITTQSSPSVACISRGTLHEEQLKDSPTAVCVGHKVKVLLKSGQTITVPEVGTYGATTCTDSSVAGESECYTIFTDEDGFPHVSRG